VAESIGKRLGRDAVGGILDGDAIIDVHTPLLRDCALRIVTVKSEAGLEVLRHSTAHLMASAVQKRFPGTQVTIGPAIESGFYYDFKREGGFTPEDLASIEAEMHAIAAADEPFERQVMDRDAARKLFESMGETFKVELIDSIPAGEPISIYRHGSWFDLCRGPHVPRTGLLKAFKLTHVAGAYWRGDEHKPMLARVYGTAFWDQKDLDAHLHMLQEAQKRDHRRVGRELDLFSFHPAAPAMPFFHPRGTVLYNTLEQYVRNFYRALGFDEVITPQVVDVGLFKQSGHYANYRQNMFFCSIDEREFGLKPMNCPGHTLIYAAAKRSYRDLPIRYADFGRLHRYERSGVTAGLTRVRSFCQDDAHIFCREDQIGREIRGQILMIQEVYQQFGFDMRVSFSTRPEQSIGTEPELDDAQRHEWNALWERAESTLRQALETAQLPYTVEAGEGAFYGPKIDCQVRDAIGRWHQLGTIQLDFALPRRFELGYTNAQSGQSTPVMVHRAVLGSLERFIGILIEHTGGDFPLWLAPCQLKIITVNEAVAAYAEEVRAACAAAGLRVELDARHESLGFKIREAELRKTPVVAVLGGKEADSRSVSLRWRKKGDSGQQPLDQAIRSVLDAAAVPLPDAAFLQRLQAEGENAPKPAN
jgi:threonyl-tRNA synthetase